MRRAIVSGLLMASTAVGLGLVACSSDETGAISRSDSGSPIADASTSDTYVPNVDSGPGVDAGGRTAKAALKALSDSGTSATATLTESPGCTPNTKNCTVTLSINVTGAVPGARGTQVHVGKSCTDALTRGGHFNPDAVTKNGEWDNTIANDAGVGTTTSTRTGLTLDQLADGGVGILGRVIVVHGPPTLLPDGGPVLTDAGTPAPPPAHACGKITL